MQEMKIMCIYIYICMCHDDYKKQTKKQTHTYIAAVVVEVKLQSENICVTGVKMKES